MKFYNKNRPLLFLILIIFTHSVSAQNTQRTQMIMGTFATITLKLEDKKEIQKGFNLLKTIEKSLSSYDKEALL